MPFLERVAVGKPDERFVYQLRRDDSADPRGFVIVGNYESAKGAKEAAK